MKKTKLRFICIFLVLCMTGSIFLSGCMEDDDRAGGVIALPRPALTVTVLTIVEDGTTPEAIQAVEAALSAISEAKYTTKIKLIGIKASDYEAEIARRFAAYDVEVEQESRRLATIASLTKASQEQARKDKLAGITQGKTKRPTESTETTLESTQRIVWPVPTEDQLDIFLITSPQMFAELLAEGEERLQGIDDELGTKAKVLKEYIYPGVMQAGQKNGARTYAVPTNKAVGKATYIAINKELAEKYELEVSKVKDYDQLMEFLAAVKRNESGMPLIEGPFESIKHYESLFTAEDMSAFPIVSYVSQPETMLRPLIYTPVGYFTGTTAPTTLRPTVPVNWDGSPMTDDPAFTTMPPTTYKNKDIPPQIILTPGVIAMQNKYSHIQMQNILRLNYAFANYTEEDWDALGIEKGLFTNNIPDGAERAAFILKDVTLEEMLDDQASKIRTNAKGEPVLDENGNTIPLYEYVIYSNPIATKDELQSSMYGISVSSKVEPLRCVEILMLMNTDSNFKNTFQYGVEGTHYIFNESGMIERISRDYNMNMDYTGNHFISSLTTEDNPNKWEIARQHNLNVVNSVFFNFTFDYSRLTVESEEAIAKVNELGKEFLDYYKKMEMGCILPEGYADMTDFIDNYLFGYIPGELTKAGYDELFKEITAQTNP